MAEVAQSQILPAPFIEAAAKPYLEKIQEVYGKPVDVSQFMGQQFVAGPGALQTQAEGLAGGLGGFQPYLQAAQAATGPQAYQAYTSPYQQDVIQSTLAEYDFQAQKGLPQLAAQAIGAGAFGGGREGVQRAEYQAMSDRNRAALFAQLQQQGFGQAQQLAAQQFGQQSCISSTCSIFIRATNCWIVRFRCTTTRSNTSRINSSTTISTSSSYRRTTKIISTRFGYH
jgi:hypothetical protein